MESKEQQPKEVQVYEEPQLQRMLQWYDQQIMLATKNKELMELKAALAKSRAEEMYAIVQIAKITAEEPQEGNQAGD